MLVALRRWSAAPAGRSNTGHAKDRWADCVCPARIRITWQLWSKDESKGGELRAHVGGFWMQSCSHHRIFYKRMFYRCFKDVLLGWLLFDTASVFTKLHSPRSSIFQMFQQPYYGLDPIWEKITPYYRLVWSQWRKNGLLALGQQSIHNIKVTLNPYQRSEDESVPSFRLPDCWS